MRTVLTLAAAAAACGATAVLAFHAGRLSGVETAPALLVSAPEAQPARGTDRPGETDLTPEQRQEMEAWMQANSLGKEHKELAEKLVGTWDVTLRARMNPSQPEFVSHGKATTERLFDGRFFLQRFESEMMGMPLHGLSLTGYSKAEGEYQSVWLDSMNTALAFSRGKKDGEGRIIYEGTETEPTTGETIPYRDTFAFKGNDEHVLTRSYVLPDGTQAEAFSITFTRAK